MKEKKNSSNKNEDIIKLKDLSEILTQYNLTAVEISENEKKYRVEKNIELPQNIENEDKSSLDSKLILKENSSSDQKKNKLESISSNMVGVFHDSSSKDQLPLIKVGQKFKKGDVLCVIEAMKTFTEVRADVSGIIKEICVKNGDLVEYSQPLFKYIKQ